MSKRPRPIALIILDGWGYREEQEHNAIAAANIPYWDHLWQQHPHTLLEGSGRCVGLPNGQMGNSEVGHLNMGAGRIVHQDFTRIENAIDDGEFFKNPILLTAIDQNIQSSHALHILGLLSPGGVHSHENQIAAAVKLAAERGASKVYLHVFLDGRDTPPRSALASLEMLTDTCLSLQCGKIVSMIGRFYAMDRDKRWDRVQKAYDLLTQGKANYHASNVIDALQMAYARGENDEFVQATTIHAQGDNPVTIEAGDTVLFMNFRSDRARELSHALLDPVFNEFNREAHPQLNAFVTLTEYENTLKTAVAFPPIPLTNTLGDYLSQLHLHQLRIAETEKYAHVTFFFNGGIEAALPGEDRLLIPSPKVATYDMQPEMSALELTEQLTQKIESQFYDVIICNFANPDMVGHTGNFQATVKAVETINDCLKKIMAALHLVGGEALITADHGNAELMFDNQTRQPHTAHTSERVPFIYIGRPADITRASGTLCDIAPTILYLMGIKQPTEMTGTSLVTLK